MRCEEAAEFVSALCDGETIPRGAAEHIGECAVCRTRLSEYAEIGAELRRVASLEASNRETGDFVEVRSNGEPEWKQVKSVKPSWWRKGWEIMRIPRFVFALLLTAVVVLGSSLVMLKVRAHTGGTVLMLTVKPSDDKTVHCALSLEDEKLGSCANLTSVHGYGFRVISVSGDRIELGVRVGNAADLTGPGASHPSTANMDQLVEKPFWFEPGEKLEIPGPDGSTLVLTGELLDHMPPWIAVDPDVQMDPKAGEIRIVSPVLLKGKNVLVDLGGMSGSQIGNDRGIEFYAPQQGLYYFSLSPIQGAAEGHIQMSRVTFEWNGEPYTLLTGTPIARGEKIWILHRPNFEPSGHVKGHAFLGGASASQVLSDPSDDK